MRPSATLLNNPLMNVPISKVLRIAGYGAAGGGLLGVLTALRGEAPEGLAPALGTILGSAAGGAALAVIAVAILMIYKR